MRRNYIWFALIFVYIVSKFIQYESGDLYKLVVVFLVYYITCLYMIVPFLLGEDMEFPAGTFKMIKGDDNAMRYVFFVLGGVFNCYCLIS